MRRARPVREHDPEWPLGSRVAAVLWKLAALACVGLVFELALLGSHEAAIVFGLLLLLGAGVVVGQSRRRPPP